MALFDPKNLYMPLGAIAGLAGAATLGFVAGYALGRDPAAAKKLLNFVARGVDRVTLAVAETREELGDLWAEARADVRAQWEAAQFAQHEEAVAAAGAAPASAGEVTEQVEAVAKARPRKNAQRARKATVSGSARRAKPPVVH